jgi:transposase-like protein
MVDAARSARLPFLGSCNVTVKGKSKVRLTTVQNTSREDIQPIIRKNVKVGSELYTDSHSGYEGLNDEYFHEFVNHAETYARGKVHTNGLENFWSLLKRGLRGTHVSVEPFHLFRYLDEQSFRTIIELKWVIMTVSVSY